jgi:hypothetical protein
MPYLMPYLMPGFTTGFIRITRPVRGRAAALGTRIQHAALACVAVAALGCAASAGAATAPAAQTLIPAPSNVAALPAGTPSGATPTPSAAAAMPADAPPASEQWIEQQVASYRNGVEARVARGDMNPDEAERLIGWRRWQLTQQAAGTAPESSIIARQNAADRRDVVVVPSPRPYYAPGYAPYYYGNGYAPGYAPYAVPPRIGFCAGGIGRHYSGAVCF